VNDSDQHRPRSLKTWGVVLGTLIVAGLAVVSFGSFAGAADSTGTGAAATATDGTTHPHPQLSDAQKQCLADNGVTLGQRPADGSRPTPPTEAERAAFKAAAEACGLPTPPARGQAPGAQI
jgi:hypothetical protein